MKTITLKITEKSPHGLRANDCYFCSDGIKAVLGRSGKAGLYISKSPFAGSTEIRVEGVNFSSKRGSYRACSDHPQAVENMLVGKPFREGYEFGQGPPTKNFRFYAKAD